MGSATEADASTTSLIYRVPLDYARARASSEVKSGMTLSASSGGVAIG